jgi:hypothetical protein
MGECWLNARVSLRKRSMRDGSARDVPSAAGYGRDQCDNVACGEAAVVRHELVAHGKSYTTEDAPERWPKCLEEGDELPDVGHPGRQGHDLGGFSHALAQRREVRQVDLDARGHGVDSRIDGFVPGA